MTKGFDTMPKLLSKLWNWGHLEGSHSKLRGLEQYNCSMTPEAFAQEYGIKNAFIVSYGGNINPPFDNCAKRFSCLDNIKWSVLGDSGTPLPEDRLAHAPDVIRVAAKAKNISGGVVDDFFSIQRVEKYTPEVLSEIKSGLNENGLDFWCVLYAHDLKMGLEKYMDCFDGVTFWLWTEADLKEMDAYVEKAFSLVKNKPLMLGIYLWDFHAYKPMDTALYNLQMSKYFELLKDKRIDGIIFCSSTIGDAPFETNKILKEYISKYGDIEV